jgi:hypothetical protein
MISSVFDCRSSIFGVRCATHIVVVRIFCLSLFCPLFSLHLHAQQVPATGPEAGRALVAGLLSARPIENVRWSGALQIFHRENPVPQVPVQCQTALGETNWTVTYLAGATASNGAEKLTIVFSTNAPPQYFYARASGPDAPLGETKTLSAAEADVPFANSDFWLSDLGFQFYHWPAQNELKGQTRRSRGCHVLESKNPNPTPGGYARVLTWIDSESNQPLQAEAYGADGNMIKFFELGSVQKVNGHYEVKNLKMTNRRTGSETSLNFDATGQ